MDPIVSETVVSEPSLEEQFAVLRTEINDITNQKTELDKLRAEKTKKLESVQTTIEANNLAIMSQTMFNDVSSLSGLDSIGKDELLEIAKGIDKTEYTSHGKSRWMDLESITKKIIVLKTQYPNWKLTKLYKTKLGQPQMTPPQNIYQFSYTDGTNTFSTM